MTKREMRPAPRFILGFTALGHVCMYYKFFGRVLVFRYGPLLFSLAGLPAFPPNSHSAEAADGVVCID